MTDLHERLVAALTARLGVARAASGRGPNWTHVGGGEVVSDGNHWAPVVYAEGYPTADEADHIAANDPVTEIRRVKALLRVVERHAPRQDEEGVICDHCVVDIGGVRIVAFWPCDDIRDLAAGEGIPA